MKYEIYMAKTVFKSTGPPFSSSAPKGSPLPVLMFETSQEPRVVLYNPASAPSCVISIKDQVQTAVPQFQHYKSHPVSFSDLKRVKI